MIHNTAFQVFLGFYLALGVACWATELNIAVFAWQYSKGRRSVAVLIQLLVIATWPISRFVIAFWTLLEHRRQLSRKTLNESRDA